MTASNFERLQMLDDSLSEFRATNSVSRELADMYSALLATTKSERFDDPIVAAISPPADDMSGRPIMDVGTMRAAIKQLLAVY